MEDAGNHIPRPFCRESRSCSLGIHHHQQSSADPSSSPSPTEGLVSCSLALSLAECGLMNECVNECVCQCAGAPPSAPSKLLRSQAELCVCRVCGQKGVSAPPACGTVASVGPSTRLYPGCVPQRCHQDTEETQETEGRGQGASPGGGERPPRPGARNCKECCQDSQIVLIRVVIRPGGKLLCPTRMGAAPGQTRLD